MKHSLRFGAFRATATLMALLLCSLFAFEPLHANHDCPGDDCPICAVIQAVHHTLGGLKNEPAHSTIILLPMNRTNDPSMKEFPPFSATTPVSQKTKLND